MDDTQLNHFLARVNAQLAKESDRTQRRVTLLIRVKPADEDRWPDFVDAFLRLAAKGKKWALDLSQAYFLADDSVRYLWRIVITSSRDGDKAKADLDHAFAAMRTAIIDVTRVEITKIPLVGQVRRVCNPATGHIRGGYGAGSPQEKALMAQINAAMKAG